MRRNLLIFFLGKIKLIHMIEANNILKLFMLKSYKNIGKMLYNTKLMKELILSSKYFWLFLTRIGFFNVIKLDWWEDYYRQRNILSKIKERLSKNSEPKLVLTKCFPYKLWLEILIIVKRLTIILRRQMPLIIFLSKY